MIFLILNYRISEKSFLPSHSQKEWILFCVYHWMTHKTAKHKIKRVQSCRNTALGGFPLPLPTATKDPSVLSPPLLLLIPESHLTIGKKTFRKIQGGSEVKGMELLRIDELILTTCWHLFLTKNIFLFSERCFIIRSFLKIRFWWAQTWGIVST